MVESDSNGSSASTVVVPVQQRRRTPLPFIILAILFVVVPFLTWYLTWFGRSLSDQKIGEYLNDEKNVRHVQQALAQIEQKIELRDAGVKRWYPRILALGSSDVVEIRKTVAWVMGQDNRSEEFHAGLLKLVQDKHPAVRRNAAVQLVRFNDASGRAELRSILQPYDVASPVEGIINTVLSVGSDVRENALVARIATAENQLQEIRSPLSGKLLRVVASEGARVATGDVILTLAPDPDFVYEALRALLFVGEEEDLPEVERYVQGVEGMPERVQQQAIQTAKAIRGRVENVEIKNAGP